MTDASGSHKISCWLLLLIVGLVGNTRAQAGDEARSRIVEANTRFSFKMFRRLVSQTPDKNILLAPTGLSQTFSFLDNGADPEARKEIESCFELSGLDLSQINEGSAALRKDLRLSTPVTATKRPPWATPEQWQRLLSASPNGTVIADSLWLKQVTFPEFFLRLGREFYGIDVKHLQATPTVAQQISRWARNRTRASIPIHPGAMTRNDFLLVDVTYFHSFWHKPFQEAATKSEEFHLLAGRQKLVPMMHQDGYFSYLEQPKFQAIILGYTQGASMYILLPSQDSSLAELEYSLTPENWRIWRPQFERRLGEFGMPRFQTETGFDVRAALKDLGVNRAFDTFAAFRPIVPLIGAMLLNAIQKTKLKVDEHGTEAVSVGLVGGVPGGVAGGQLPPPKPFEMILNRPFFFAIEDEPTQQLLFLGAIVDP